MEKILIIDTSKQNTYIILSCGKNVYSKILEVQTKVSENLLPNIENVLNEANITLKEIDGLCVVTGPGSFTGIRVGLTTIKAFAQALNIGVIAKNSFEVLTKKVKNGVVLLKSTNTSMYFGEIVDGNVKNVGVVKNEEVEEMFNNKTLFEIKNETNMFKSEKLEDYDKLLLDYFNVYGVNNNTQSYLEIEPFYIQLSQAEINLKNKGQK